MEGSPSSYLTDHDYLVDTPEESHPVDPPKNTGELPSTSRNTMADQWEDMPLLSPGAPPSLPSLPREERKQQGIKTPADGIDETRGGEEGPPMEMPSNPTTIVSKGEGNTTLPLHQSDLARSLSRPKRSMCPRRAYTPSPSDAYTPPSAGVPGGYLESRLNDYWSKLEAESAASNTSRIQIRSEYSRIRGKSTSNLSRTPNNMSPLPEPMTTLPQGVDHMSAGEYFRS
ncbi:hypothetical protein PMAYCL1PPCAC_06263, partial [Pristionchus mayeri]